MSHPQSAPFPDLAEAGFMGLVQKEMPIFTPIMEATDAIMRGHGDLSPAEREMIASYVSQKTGCGFCQTSHAALANILGIDEIDQVIASPPPSYGALFKLADAVIDQRVNRADVDAVISAGYAETVAREVIYVTAIFGFFNRIVSAFGFQTTPEADRQTAQYLKDSYKLA